MRRTHPASPVRFESSHGSVRSAPPSLRMMLENGRANGRRWRVSAGFLVQAAILALILLLPIFHTEPPDARPPTPRSVLTVAISRGQPHGTPEGPGGKGGLVVEHRPVVEEFSSVPLLILPEVDAVPAGSAPEVGPGNGSGSRLGVSNGSDIGAPWGISTQVRPPAPDGPFPPVGDLRPPRILRQVEPDYPEMARRMGLEGDVRLRAVLTAEGHVEEVTVLGGPPLLAQAARAAVAQWLYEPTYLSGRPVPVVLEVTVQFKLRR